jgi:hypothetical protein
VPQSGLSLTGRADTESRLGVAPDRLTRCIRKAGVSIFDEGKAKAARDRNRGPSPDEIALEEARRVITTVNTQVPELYSRLKARAVPTDAVVVKMITRPRTFLDRLFEASLVTVTQPLGSGWTIFRLSHYKPDQVGSRSPAGPGVTVNRSLIIIMQDGRVVEADGSALLREYSMNDMPPKFIYPEADAIKYCYELQEAASRYASMASGSVQLAAAFANLYKQKVVDFVAEKL